VVVEQTSYDPEQTASIFGRNAMFFWAGVKGERTEGHPYYRGFTWLSGEGFVPVILLQRRLERRVFDPGDFSVMREGKH
jgi:hypothetical protein